MFIGTTVNHLVEGVIHMFWIKKATAAMVAVTVVFGLGLGVGVTARTGTATANADDQPGVVPTPVQVAGNLRHDLASFELHDRETALRAAFLGYSAVKQQLDVAIASGAPEAERTELQQNIKLLQGQ
jgi:hypothetical protein